MKGFLKLSSFYANKVKGFTFFQKLGSHGFSWIANSILNKVKSAIAPLFNNPDVLSSESDKTKLLAKNFPKNSKLDDCGISLQPFPGRNYLKLHNVSLTPKLIKNVITNSHSSKSFYFRVGSKEIWVWTSIHISWPLQYVSEGTLFSRFLEGLIFGPCISEFWGEVF